MTPVGSIKKPEPKPGSTSSNLDRAVAALPCPSTFTTAGSTRFTTGDVRVPVARQHGLARWRPIGRPAVEAAHPAINPPTRPRPRQTATDWRFMSLTPGASSNSIAGVTRKPGFVSRRSRAVEWVGGRRGSGRPTNIWPHNAGPDFAAGEGIRPTAGARPRFDRLPFVYRQQSRRGSTAGRTSHTPRSSSPNFPPRTVLYANPIREGDRQ